MPEMSKSKFKEKAELVLARILDRTPFKREDISFEIIDGTASGEWCAYFRPIDGSAAFVYVEDDSTDHPKYFAEYPEEKDFTTFDRDSTDHDLQIEAWRFAVAIEAAIRDRVHQAI